MKIPLALFTTFHGNPESPDIANILMTIETPAFKNAIRDSELTEARDREPWVSERRKTLDPEFLEGLERMRGGALAVDDQQFFRLAFGRWLFHGNCPTLHEVADEPGCQFDERFGFPCSERQAANVEKARKEHRHLERY